MQTSLIKKNQLTKEIKGYLKFYFSSQELTYLTPKILETLILANPFKRNSPFVVSLNYNAIL